MAFLRFIYMCFIEVSGFKSYGLLQVMGYHSMGYLRFDCIVIIIQVIYTKSIFLIISGKFHV